MIDKYGTLRIMEMSLTHPEKPRRWEGFHVRRLNLPWIRHAWTIMPFELTDIKSEPHQVPEWNQRHLIRWWVVLPLRNFNHSGPFNHFRWQKRSPLQLLITRSYPIRNKNRSHWRISAGGRGSAIASDPTGGESPGRDSFLILWRSIPEQKYKNTTHPRIALGKGKMRGELSWQGQKLSGEAITSMDVILLMVHGLLSKRKLVSDYSSAKRDA